MAFTDNCNGTGMYMPVAPMGYGMNGMYGGMGMGGFGYEGMWWILIAFMLFGRGYNNGGSGNGYGYGGGVDNVAIGSIGGNCRDAIQNSFDHQAVMSRIGEVGSGVAGVTAAVNEGFANAEIANNGRQIADMQQQFNYQTAITSALNGVQERQADCCCENRLAVANLNSTILSEDCATRTAVANGVNQIVVNENNNTQRLIDSTNKGFQTIMDKICRLEIDGIKQNYENRITALQNALDEARLSAQSLATSAARTAQTAAIIANNDAQTVALEQYLAPPARPAWIVPNPNANVYGNGCYNYYNGGNCCGNAA